MICSIPRPCFNETRLVWNTTFLSLVTVGVSDTTHADMGKLRHIESG